LPLTARKATEATRKPPFSAWQAAEPSSQRVLHAQRTLFEDQFCDVSAGIGARGGPEKLIKMATDQLDGRTA
jgi:hypothetical protein